MVLNYEQHGIYGSRRVFRFLLFLGSPPFLIYGPGGESREMVFFVKSSDL